MKQMGLKAYRFSICWPRVIPEGTGKVNQKGLDFYNSLVDELIANNIEPFITLFHWDFPHELFLRDGWLNPDSPKWFEDYTEVVEAGYIQFAGASCKLKRCDYFSGVCYLNIFDLKNCLGTPRFG